MKRLLALISCLIFALNASAAPLRVFIRGGKKSHGPNAHEHERFLNDWKVLLAERGMQTDGAMDWPTAEQFKNTDVLVMYAQDGGNATPEQKADLAEFNKRGGGIVVIHTAAVSNDPAWWKCVIGGAWVQGKTKWKEGPVDLYYVENQRLGEQHPITKGASNFHIDDEIYYDMDLSPDIRVLATSYTPNVPDGKKVAAGGKANIYDIQPQMWAYEKDNYRAFVTIPGHLYFTFEKPFFRAILMRGIAWAGKRANVDEFCKPEEISALTYPEGGPQRPADTLKALEVAPDFLLKLVAGEPLITKPINFDWDPAGRLWVAETPEYPNGRRGMRPDYRGHEWKDHGGIDADPGEQKRKALDKISILTDTDGDGVMDKKDVFYEGLELVTGLVFYKDGVIVTQAPDILWLRDTNHDGKADKVVNLYTGLGTGDTHAVINNPRWGWDGWIYCTHGYSAGQVTSPDGKKDFGNIGSGVVRFKPDGSAFEQYSSKGGNTWGLEITGDNRVMWTQPTSGDLLMQVMLPEYALAKGKIGDTPGYNIVEKSGKTYPAMPWEQLAYVQIDWVGSFTAAAGSVIYDGGSWPSEFNGDYLCTEPTINIVHHTRLTKNGSSYTASRLPGREETELIRSRDMWWRPIEVRVAPDGSVLVADFYNQAVIHNDTRGPDHNGVGAAVRPDRDHYFGRIWKLDHKDAKKIEVPDLSKAGVKELVAALAHPNRSVRMTASRLLVDMASAKNVNLDAVVDPIISKLQMGWESITPESKIASLWTLEALGSANVEILTKALVDKDAIVRRNAANVIEGQKGNHDSLITLLSDEDASVRLAALRALAAGPLGDDAAKAIIAAWPKFDDDFQKSAAVGAAAQNHIASINAALDSSDPVSLASLVDVLAQSITHADEAAKLIISLSGKPAIADPLKGSILGSLAKTVKDKPAMTGELRAALKQLLGSGGSFSALVLGGRWDDSGDFAGSLSGVIEDTKKRVFNKELPEKERMSVAQSLLALREFQPEIVSSVAGLLADKAISGEAKAALIGTLAETGDAAAGPALATAFPALDDTSRAAVFEALLTRSEWSLALLDATKEKKADITILGPANLARLRTYPDPSVAKVANALLDELMGPALHAKAETLAKLIPEVEKPGDAEKGKMLFTATCATCHRLNGEGADVGPGLTGMGAHGPAELLAAIIDPNREVDPSFAAWNIETNDGRFHAGIIARENRSRLIMKSLAGQDEIRKEDIKSRVNTGRSLMPEGFEGLGAEALRDILTYICGADAQKFRTIDLRTAFTADTRKGLYDDDKALDDTLVFKKFGNVEVENIPFRIVDPVMSTNGNNVIVLKGGNGFARTLPQRVEAKVGGFTANRLHFLGGVSGWGYAGAGDPTPVMKVTVFYSDQKSEEMTFNEGVEFADYGPRIEVPGSKFADVLKQGQVRYFSVALKRTAPIDRIVMESFAGNSAPTTVAITAELAK